jgi:hypothetical protein
MSLELALIYGFILHFVGDYCLQNDWMATHKTKAFLPAFIHALVYSVPFGYLTPSAVWLIIVGTHFLIDRYRLAMYWVKLMNWQSSNFGFDEGKPVWLSFWLLIIVDNTFHVIINSVAIVLFYRD